MVVIAFSYSKLQAPVSRMDSLGRREVCSHLLLRDLRVVDVQVAAIAHQALAHIDGRRLSRVTRVLQHHTGELAQACNCTVVVIAEVFCAQSRPYCAHQ